METKYVNASLLLCNVPTGYKPNHPTSPRSFKFILSGQIKCTALKYSLGPSESDRSAAKASRLRV